MARTKEPENVIHRHFMRRWKDHIGKQYGIFRSVVDSVVLLYIGIPAMLIFGRSYYVLWEEELPGWLMELPYAVIPLLLYFLIHLGGGLTTYQENADVLFMHRNEQWNRGIVLRGILVSLVTQALIWGLIILILLPILLRVYTMTGVEIGLLYVIVAGIKAVAMLSENLIGIYTARWRKVLYQSLVQLVLGGVFIVWAFILHPNRSLTVAIVLLLLTTVVWLVRLRTHTVGLFEAEIRMEEYQKTRLTGLVLSGATSSPRKARSRPWLFRRSNQLLRSRQPESRLAEAMMKSFFRGRDLVMYLQFIAVGIAAVAAPPFPVNVVVFTLLMVLLYYWLNGFRKHFLERDLLAILPISPELKHNSVVPSNRLLLQPGVVFISAGLGVSLFEAIGGVALGVPAAVVLYVPYIAKMLLR
ncbi:ABC transporter permease [Paenibacillus lentus]|uniref:Uncharacterized protein n=1 Tax=Paenibacillus lentus TaxID=1338368 RepID=A0A3Q8S3C6_9BACL|nr:ABC transporter permease [Paenibacillus lentus]AZK44849.1 hypothetical protein EIM92_00415 [Paenibacillus lentus]